jgi:hypothetical protein
MKLQINFAVQPRPPRLMRLGLGSASLLLCCALVWTMTGETEAGLRISQANLPSEAKVTAINQGIDDLNFPWLSILDLLEKHSGNDLRFSRIEADTRNSRLTLHGEAKETRAVIALPEQLRADPLVGEARISGQSTSEDAAAMEYPTRFSLELQILPSGGR